MTHAIAQIFQESAHANSTHKKNVLSLRKQLLKCTGNAVAAQQFLSEIARCIRKVLPLKKGLQVAERTVHFFQNFLKACEDFQTEDGSLYNRMVEELLRELSNGFNAKDKNVRFRVCQIVGVLLNNISELDDDLFSTLCEKLLERTQDKEPMVRAQAARGLENFCDDDEVFKTIRQLLECDPSGDVRKAVLETVYWSKENISLFAKRCRDRDVNVRKVVYPTLCKLDGCLSNQDREVLLQGLYDRDNEIRQRCIRWVCLKLVPEHGILKLLHELDLSTDLPAHLLSCVLQTIDSKDILRQDICKAETWDNLTPVTAFYIRVCISHYLDNQMYDKVEETLPPLNHQVAVLQKHCALMIEGGDNDAFVQEQQFILGELLMIAEVEDFADELGRRQMLSFLRDLLVTFDMSEPRLMCAIRTIRKLAANDRDFTRLIVEVVYDICDIDGEPGAENQAVGQAIDASQNILLVHRCLDIIKGLLQYTTETWKDSPSLQGLIRQFVYSSMQSTHMLIRESALHCLGLAFLLDRDRLELVLANMPAFVEAFHSEQKNLQMLALKVIFDTVKYYGMGVFAHRQSLVNEETIHGIFSTALTSGDYDVVTLAVTGLTGLFASKKIENLNHLEVLVALYFHPSTAAVPRLRQCLGLFFDVMSSQRYEDQQLIQKVVVRSYKFLVETYKEHKRDMVAPLLISKQLSSWTDIRHLQLSVKSRDKCLHLLTAKELLDLAWKTPELAKDLCQMLGTFHIIGDVDDNDARELSILCDNVTQLVFDSPTKNSIKKFKALFKYEEVEEAEPESGEQSEGS